MAWGSPPRLRTIRRAARIAAGSPSIANETPASDGRDPRTNVISGCTDATAAPLLRSGSRISLPNAPLECSAIFPAARFLNRCRLARLQAQGLLEVPVVGPSSFSFPGFPHHPSLVPTIYNESASAQRELVSHNRQT